MDAGLYGDTVFGSARRTGFRHGYVAYFPRSLLPSEPSTPYDALQGVRRHGDLDGRLRLFLDGVHIQANDALARAERLSDLRERYRRAVQAKTRPLSTPSDSSRSSAF